MIDKSYTNLERLQDYAAEADDCPEVLARYLCGYDFCVHPDGCQNKQIPCENCIKNWLNERAEA